MVEDEQRLPPGLTPEMLEKFRNLISLDKEGNWFYDEQPITHERTVAFLNETLQRNEEGRFVVRSGKAWSYVRIEDTPYMIRAVREEGGPPPDRIRLLLSDGTSETLAPETLCVGDKDVLYCKVKGGAEEARFLRQAYYQIAAHIAESESGFVLKLTAGDYPVGRRKNLQ